MPRHRFRPSNLADIWHAIEEGPRLDLRCSKTIGVFSDNGLERRLWKSGPGGQMRRSAALVQ
jgi:hypothetical protein